jgi:hypothetical protein
MGMEKTDLDLDDRMVASSRPARRQEAGPPDPAVAALAGRATKTL